MISDAITAGVNPGGLQSRTEIRVLICFLLDNVSTPLPLETIKERLHFEGIANYFETAYAISDLEENGNIQKIECDDSKALYVAAGDCSNISDALATSVPFSVRERSLIIANEVVARCRNERENKVTVEKKDNGMYVTCSIMDNDFELASVRLLIPDEETANTVKDNFYKDPMSVFAKITEGLLGTKI